jgi:hypothetical protein
VRDQLGTELKVGDTVMAKIGNDWVMGGVTKIQQGGLAVAGAMPKNGQPVNMTPDALVIQVAVICAGHPGQPQPFVVKVATPNVVDQITESSIKM